MKEMRLYDLLGVQPGVDLAALKKSYRNLAKKFHPDKNPEGGEVFKNISMAYDILSDPEKRKVYDVSGEQGIQGGRAEEEEHRQLSATGQPLLAQGQQPGTLPAHRVCSLRQPGHLTQQLCSDYTLSWTRVGHDINTRIYSDISQVLAGWSWTGSVLAEELPALRRRK